MGQPPKPLELRRKLGNPGKRPMPKEGTLVALPAAHGVPEPHRPLGDHGLELWTRIWTAASLWLSPATDAEVVLIVCESLDERSSLRFQVLAAKDRLDRGALRALDAQIMQGLGALGFDPVNRARLGVAEIKQVSALEELAARRASGANRGIVTIDATVAPELNA